MPTSNLENNIVFESIQPCLLDLVNSSKSEILYANGFSGTPPIAMPEGIANLFKSDFGMVGTNILVQLENKMSGVPGGPWYIDSRDDCIYIHNRNFQDLPVYTYEYMAGSGELLDVSFKTNYVKKQVQGGIQSGVNQDKEIKQDIVLAPELTLGGPPPTRYSHAPYDSNNDGSANPSTDQYIDLETPSVFGFEDPYQMSLFGTRDNSNQELLNLYKSAKSDKEAQAIFDNKINNDRIEAYYKQLSLDDLKRESQSIFEQTSTNLGITQEQLMNKLQEAMDSGNLESYLKQVFGSSNHIFDNPYQMFGTRPTTVKVHELDLFQLGIPYTGQHNELGAYISHGDTNTDYISIDLRYYGTSYSDPSVEEAAQSAGRIRSKDLLNSLNKDQDVVEVLEVGKLKITPLPQDDPRYSIFFYQAIYSQRVKILVKSDTNTFSIPTYRVISDLYTRQLGENSTINDVEAHVRKLLHANDAVMEKVITCRLTCMGNPFLASSQVLTLKNVGKWSGKWYIKTCKHNFNTSGYTCLLDLVLNSSLPGSSSVSTGITLDQPWDKNALRQVMMNVTSAESLYYTSLKEEKDKVDFILLLISNKLLENEYQDEFNDRGIVRVSSTTSTTSNKSNVEYTLDSQVNKIPDEIRKTYESAAEAAVRRNKLTESMEKAVNENNK